MDPFFFTDLGHNIEELVLGTGSVKRKCILGRINA